MFKTFKCGYLLGIAIIVLATLGGVGIGRAATQTVTALTGNSGLTSLRYGGTEFLSNGEFHVDNVVLRRLNGSKTNADVSSQVTWDADKHRITRAYSWGSASCAYALQGARLDLTVDVQNTSNEIIDGIDLQLMELKFPQAPQGWVPNALYVSDNRGTPTVITAAFKGGTLAVCNEDTGRPLLFGFPGRASVTVQGNRIRICHSR